MNRTVVIDCFPESAARYLRKCAIVVVDVFRFTTTVATALAHGRRVFPVASTDEGAVRAGGHEGALLVGELGGNLPYGWDLQNSPSELARRNGSREPIVLLSSSGARLLCQCRGATSAVYAACLRNARAVADHVAARHARVAVLGAGTRGVFRREDQLCCARVAARLADRGFEIADEASRACVARWRDVPLEALRRGRSAEYLRRSGQERDIEFVLAHVDDLPLVPQLFGDELREAAP